MALNYLQSVSGTALGNPGISSALQTLLGPNGGATTTTVNLYLVVNGTPQWLIQSLRVDEQFNEQRMKAIGSAINVAIVPGVYEATAAITKLFLFGLTVDQAFGGPGKTVRPVIGKYLRDPDFTKNYFNIVVVDQRGFPIAVHHDCVMASETKAYDSNNIVIMEDANVLIRWSESL